MEWLIITGYLVALLVVCLFSIEQFYLTILYLKHSRNKQSYPPLQEYPAVTVQLPVYNEKYVIERLIDTICQIQYPNDKLEIQVLDDSTDETSTLIENKITQCVHKGIDIKHIRRENRQGFKAGALAHGLSLAKGKFIAIFDADFMPKSDFLTQTLPAFDSDAIGMVQTRWGHLNQDFSMLTEIQAFGLNAHFTVEQRGRYASGKLMSFNGTAGIWRKSCIEDAGGWQHDTLTEDLDLSYRAQMKRWKFRYLEDVLAPAELPVLISAIKSQQYRWNKGAAETARKLIISILKSELSIHQKFHSVIHLLNSSVFIFLFLAALLSIPTLHIQNKHPESSFLFNLTTYFTIGFLGMTIFYWTANSAANPEKKVWHRILYFPLFLSASLGMVLHNTIAVMEGYLNIKTPFVRTPKFNIQFKNDSWKDNTYLNKVPPPVTLIEGLLFLYFLFGMISGLWIKEYGMLAFHLMLTIGFGMVFFLSVISVRHATIGKYRG